MSKEFSIRTSMLVKAGNLSYQRQSSFTGNLVAIVPKGVVPGSILCSITGTQIDFSQLTTPAYCVLTNLDALNYVTYGVYDSDTNTFFPLGEILPGESYVLRLSRFLHEEYPGTGTGVSASTNRLMIRAEVAACNVLIEAFEA